MNSNDSRKKILIADDEAMTLEFFEVMLGNLGFETKTARDGAEALDLLARWKPDLILLDNVLPKVSGWELTRAIRSGENFRDIADIPIVMFSAMDDVKDKVEGLELGADDYITKPFNFSEVLARIRALLRTRELVGQIERREERIRLSEEIADRVLFFVKTLGNTLEKLTAEASGLLPECGTAGPFVDHTRKELAQALAQLDELNAVIEPLKNEAENLKKGDTALPALKKPYKNISAS
ncbi:MAG: response regulator [Rectinemataceae bacterium]